MRKRTQHQARNILLRNAVRGRQTGKFIPVQHLCCGPVERGKPGHLNEQICPCRNTGLVRPVPFQR